MYSCSSLLQDVGFQASKDGKRLIWENTKGNMMYVQYIHGVLSQMRSQAPSNNINENKQKNRTKTSSNNHYRTNSRSMKQTNNKVQTQHDTTQFISNLTMNQSVPFGPPQFPV